MWTKFSLEALFHFMLLEELMHIGFGGKHMITLFGSREEKSNS